MSDKEEITQGIFTQNKLYYDLGYTFTKRKKTDRIINREFMGYLFLISIVLHFVFLIPQNLTLLFIILIFLQRYLFPEIKDSRISLILLILLFVVNVIDHSSNGIEIAPGELINPNLGLVTWGFELLWIIIFGLQALVMFQPQNPDITLGQTVSPLSPNAKQDFVSLKQRLSGTEYEIKTTHELVEIDYLRALFLRLIYIVIVVFILLLSLDIIFWAIITNQISGGETVSEQYFISGLGLLIFVILIIMAPIYSGSNEDAS